MPSTKLRFGILSTGNIARQFADGVAGSQRCEISAVASRDGDRAADFAKARNITNNHGSYDALLADDTVDAVYNALPNHMHHEWTIKALAAGKHVLCEKPFSVTVDEAKEMFDAARQHDRVLIEAFMYRSHPQTKKIVEMIRADEIGKLKVIRTSFCFNVQNTQGNIRFSADMAGGSLMDIGCYCLDLGQLLTGESPARITGVQHRHESGVDDYAAGSVIFPSGTVLSFVSGMTVQCDNVTFIGGERGYFEVPWMWKPRGEHAKFKLRGQIPPRQDPNQQARGDQVIDAMTDTPLYGLEADDFAATVLDGAPSIKTADETIATMQALSALRN